MLIDGDQYVDYVFRNGFSDFKIKGMFRFYESLNDVLEKEGKTHCFPIINLLHTVEALGFIYVLAELTNLLWVQAVFWGKLFHLLTDLCPPLVDRGGKAFGRYLSCNTRFGVTK